ncbi:MAG: glycosyltransferase family A protein, partial [Tepidisphaeraceae bacterium]|jgi:glycosyltransferase involved in cell wall biosynthesis
MAGEGEAGLASIIIPTYNRAVLLDEALASAVGQSYRPIEIIVVDDGSVDDTPGVVERWQREIEHDSHATLRYHRQSNSGVGSARNRGLIESRGEFIQFLDSDDLLHPEKLRLQIDCLRQHTESGYTFSDWTVAENRVKWDSVSGEGAAELESAELYCSLRVSWVMVGVYRRKTCRLAGPFREEMQSGEDKEYNLRAMLSTKRVCYLPGKLFASRVHPGCRITDGLNVGQDYLISTARLYRCMTESAEAEGRLGNRRLVRALQNGWSGIIIDSLKLGRRDLALESIERCRKMPVGLGGRVQLAIYQILTLVPKRVLWIVLRLRRRIRRVVARLFPS